MIYKSTRGHEECSASKAILKGLASDGGLFVPEFIPKLDVALSDLVNMSYKEVAYSVMKDYLDDFTEEELRNCINNAYDEKFDTPDIAPLRQVGDKYFLELFHGPTIAFKDMALSLLPHLLTTAMKKNNVDKEIVILTATSGDTGKAALAGFSDVPGTKIIVFYPHGGVSHIQELQMVTTTGKNTHVIAGRGNFDDCQNGVKKIFNDESLRKLMADNGYQFSSANSINIGRLVPQVAYYVYAYAQMMKIGAISEGEAIDFVVPTGNFGNILAAYFAKKMGLPVGKLVCASNDNKVLFDFFKTGVYDKNREFILTTSPSMDILISSNLERLIYFSCGCDPVKNSSLMEQLKNTGRYEIDDEMKAFLIDFYGACADMEEVRTTQSNIFTKFGYTIDPHTAVAAFADEEFKNSGESSNKSVIISTASPYKFSDSVLDAISMGEKIEDEFAKADRIMEITKMSIPVAVDSLRNAKVIHNNICSIEKMPEMVKAYLSI